MEFMYKKAAKAKPKTICTVCHGQKTYIKHNVKSSYGKKYGHRFEPRKETRLEAAYRLGYEEGSRNTADRIHWGPGWD